MTLIIFDPFIKRSACSKLQYDTEEVINSLN